MKRKERDVTDILRDIFARESEEEAEADRKTREEITAKLREHTEELRPVLPKRRNREA